MVSPISSPDLDTIRRAHPDLAFGIYALEPRGIVTLEAITPDGQVFTWKEETLSAALTKAFPPEEVAEPAPPDDDIFA